MKKISKRFIGAMLAMTLIVTMVPFGDLTASATNASAQSAITTGSIITYGSYPQTRVTDSGLIAALNAQPLQGDSTVTYGGSKYKRVYFTQYTPYYTTGTPNASNSYQDDNGYYINTVYWFKFEPLQWRVLSNTNGELFVMADKILASRAYNQAYTDVTWETCTIRSWLNNDFYNTAFNSTERAKIKTSTVVNANNPWNGTSGGNNTNDKLFLLSYSEVMNPAYGFSSDYGNYDTARRAQGTDYAKSNGLLVYISNPYSGNSHWWLRSPGFNPYSAGVVGRDGNVTHNNYGVHDTRLGARPAFKLNLTSDIFTSLTPSFTYDNQVYNEKLAKMGAEYCVQLSKSSPNGSELKSKLTSKNDIDMWGYEEAINFPANSYDSDGIGCVIACKKVNGGDYLITVIIRGTEGSQWQGNMDITGNDYNSAIRNHYSFNYAKDIVKERLKTVFINNADLPGRKILFITGHSRGAAVANLLAKDMTDENYKVHAYTFATPNVSLDATAANNLNYKNINNFCFAEDFVTQSPLSSWHYGKFGITRYDSAQDLYSN